MVPNAFKVQKAWLPFSSIVKAVHLTDLCATVYSKSSEAAVSEENWKKSLFTK